MTGTVIHGPLLTSGTGGRVLDFRRRGSPPRRKRPSLLLALLRPLVAALLLVALPVGLTTWVLTAPRFQLRDVAVTGPAQRVPAAWVLQALAPLEGGNLVRLSLADAAARLHENPWIAAVEIEKDLPDRLKVEVVERRPEALLLSGDDLSYADEDGRPIAPVRSAEEREAARRAGLLVVRFVHAPHPGGVAAALQVAGDLGRVEPDWSAKLSRIEVLGEDDFRLYTDALPFPLLVTSGQVQDKGRRLQRLLPELANRYPKIEAVDLRFSRRIVVQPALAAPRPGGSLRTNS